ncbi:MAG: S8 family serine peptidase [Thermoanaerobaculia bacterium]|nr:S8 family serine peptidase [Thermoanaerobaculia bacterium]
MKIRFLEDTNIRRAPRVTDADPPVGMMFKGAEIEVEPDMVSGESLQNISGWYHDKHGWYYWSGRAEKIIEEPPPAPPGGIFGGVVMFPVDEKEEHPDEDMTTPPPPLANDDALLNNGEIPEGETRAVPSLEVLLEEEKRLRAGVGTLPRPPKEIGPDILMPAGTRSTAPPSFARDPLAPPATAPEPAQNMATVPVFWQNPAPQKLNWGVQNALIPRDWWLSRHLTGRGATIAILSTGADPSHPDLPGIAGRFQADNGPLEDRHGLGTQAAVVAAGCGQTVFGVAPEARLLIGKIGEQDHLITPEQLVQGLRWAIGAGADVVAMLVDLPDLDPLELETLQSLVDRAIEQDILLVAPVGTSENKKPESRYPARLKGVLSVGAHDQYGQRCAFSARSYDLDLLAPGEGLLTSTPGRQTGTNLKSTSIAAAFTAGFLALVRQWQRENRQPLAPTLLFNLLCETSASRRTFNKGEDVEYGYGTLNPAEILKKLDASKPA